MRKVHVGITPSQALLLDQLWQEDGAPLKELGARTHLDPTSVNWLVAQLEKAGLAERRRGGEDRRVVRLWLTPAGDALRWQLAPEIERLGTAVQGVLLRFLAPAQLGALTEGVRALVRELPEGDDLLAAVEAEWDRRMDRLRLLIESDNQTNGGHEP